MDCEESNMRKRNYFGDTHTNVYVGVKSVDIRFSRKNTDQLLKLIRMLLQGIESGAAVDITAHFPKNRTTKSARITVTSQ